MLARRGVSNPVILPPFDPATIAGIVAWYKAVGIVYDGTSTSTSGRPLIGEAYIGPLVAMTTSDVHLTGAM